MIPELGNRREHFAKLNAANAVVMFLIITRQFNVTNVKCGFTMTALSSLISSMKPCKIQAVPGFVQNVNCVTSQTHSFLSHSRETWRYLI